MWERQKAVLMQKAAEDRAAKANKQQSDKTKAEVSRHRACQRGGTCHAACLAGCASNAGPLAP